MHLPAAVPANEGTRGFSKPQRGQPARNFSTVADGNARPQGGSMGGLVTFEHDLAELARPLRTLTNQYRDEHGHIEAGNPVAAALTKTEYMEGLESGKIPFGKPRKYGIDSHGEIYIAGINANGKQSGHIDLMARIDAKAKAQDTSEPRMVMAGMVTARQRPEDGRIVLKVGNQSGHTMPEGDPLQDEFAQAAFAQSFPQAEVFTQRFHGRSDPQGNSAYRQVPRDGMTIAELTALTERIAAENAKAAPIVAAPPDKSA
ncbi:hypothetical protein [Caenimonas koreensis]|uniref:Uncharacterized protein n=2 Tax=Caenimonas TaxID=763439 RepID=A0A844B752_9BURK|nr:hypothetical protein [Caenimonas koreensis DSM 17982]